VGDEVQDLLDLGLEGKGLLVHRRVVVGSRGGRPEWHATAGARAAAARSQMAAGALRFKGRS
jgi:hypothetical protein